MAQFNRLEIGRRGREVLDHQTVVVTHVENPSLFFCRLLTEDEEFNRLQCIISQLVEQRQENDSYASPTAAQNKIVLVYSGIRKGWCRARIISSVQSSIAKVISLFVLAWFVMIFLMFVFVL